MSVVLETTRLWLRPCVESDLDALHRLWTEPAVRYYLWDDQVISREQAATALRTSVDSFARHGLGLWAVCLSFHDELIGFCGFRRPAEGQEIELLYGLHPLYWKRGFATEAVNAVLRYGFETLEFATVTAATDVPNTASARVMERAGMIFEGRTHANGIELFSYQLSARHFEPGAATYRVRRTTAVA
jgi:RimJ/RimL family protein N-acetyltransferase